MVSRQAQAFIVVGVSSVVMDVGTLELLLALKCAPQFSVFVAFLAGLVTNYFGHAKFTFQSQTTPAVALKFATVVLVNYAITVSCVALSLTLVSAVLPGKLISFLVIPMNTFFVGKYWVFKQT